MNTGEVTSIVAIIGLILSTLGITGVDSTIITGAVNGVVSLVVIFAAILSWLHHRWNNQ